MNFRLFLEALDNIDFMPFLQTIMQNRFDYTPMLIFADWLEEHGKADLGNFIRLAIELNKLNADNKSHVSPVYQQYHDLRTKLFAEMKKEGIVIEQNRIFHYKKNSREFGTNRYRIQANGLAKYRWNLRYWSVIDINKVPKIIQEAAILALTNMISSPSILNSQPLPVEQKEEQIAHLAIAWNELQRDLYAPLSVLAQTQSRIYHILENLIAAASHPLQDKETHRSLFLQISDGLTDLADELNRSNQIQPKLKSRLEYAREVITKQLLWMASP